MRYLLEGYAEISRWAIEGDALVLEAWHASGVDLPPGPDPVVRIELRQCVFPEGIRGSLDSLAAEGLWSVSQSDSPTGAVIEFEADDGSRLAVPCGEATLSRRPLSAPDYEKAFAHLRWVWESSEARRNELEHQLEQLRAFVTGRIERQQRIIEEATAAMRDARLKAKARLDALREVQKRLEIPGDT